MKTLFLCKRRPMGRDLIERPYGRFFYLPYWIARQGHEVRMLVLSYENEPELHVEQHGISWISESLLPWGPISYLRKADELIRNYKPDWIIGFSDTYYGILAQYLAKKHAIRAIIDAYDNYESYIPWLKPIHYLWRKALAEAEVVTAAGLNLAEFMGRFRPEKDVVIVPMAADPIFVPMDRNNCRARLSLPQNKSIVGYCGSIHKSRGINFFFEIAEHLAAGHPEIEFVMAGRRQKSIKVPDKIRWLGILADDQMPILVNSLDVMLVLNQPSSFGHYSYPVKLYEAMRCNVPVVAADSEGTKWILAENLESLARMGDIRDFVNKILLALKGGPIEYKIQNSWEKSAMAFESCFIDKV